MILPDNENASQKIKQLKKSLESPILDEIVKEYHRTKNKNKGYTPNWYSLFDGPKNIRALVNDINVQSLYKFLFQYWSQITHSGDIINGKISKNEKGGLNIHQICNPSEAQDITRSIISISLNIYNIFLTKRLPYRLDEYFKWLKDFKKRTDVLDKRKFIIMQY